MKIARLVAIVAACLALQTAQARSSVPVMNHEAVPAVLASGDPASPERIRTALQAAGPVHGWQITPTGPGQALAVLSVRGKHSVSADISWQPGQYSIAYRDSSNMNYEPGAGAGRIHPKYNMWVQTLMDDIRMQLAR